MKKYYSLRRPVGIGTYPKSPDNPLIDFYNYDDRKEVEGVRAWGELYYRYELSKDDITAYELYMSKEST